MFKTNKILSGTDRKNQDELPTLAGVLTPERALPASMKPPSWKVVVHLKIRNNE